MNVNLPAELTDAQAEAIFCGLYPSHAALRLTEFERSAAREMYRHVREALTSSRKVTVRAVIECSPGGFRLQHVKRADGLRLDHVGELELTGEYEEPRS